MSLYHLISILETCRWSLSQRHIHSFLPCVVADPFARNARLSAPPMAGSSFFKNRLKCHFGEPFLTTYLEPSSSLTSYHCIFPSWHLIITCSYRICLHIYLELAFTGNASAKEGRRYCLTGPRRQSRAQHSTRHTVWAPYLQSK